MDLVQHLESEYRRRVNSNPSYSLRAFARDLHVDQSSLSKALARKRRFTEAVAKRISDNLELSPKQALKLLSNYSVVTPQSYSEFAYDEFVSVSEWYYDAILELIETVDFRPEATWIAKRLNLRSSVVNAAVLRLQRMGLLSVGRDGIWTDNSKHNSIHPHNANQAALKKCQQQVLSQSSKAIRDVDLLSRSHTSNTFACSPQKIEEAKRLIAKCRRDVASILRSSDEPKIEVFQIQISLFPITKKLRKKT